MARGHIYNHDDDAAYDGAVCDGMGPGTHIRRWPEDEARMAWTRAQEDEYDRWANATAYDPCPDPMCTRTRQARTARNMPERLCVSCLDEWGEELGLLMWQVEAELRRRFSPAGAPPASS